MKYCDADNPMYECHCMRLRRLLQSIARRLLRIKNDEKKLTLLLERIYREIEQ